MNNDRCNNTSRLAFRINIKNGFYYLFVFYLVFVVFLFRILPFSFLDELTCILFILLLLNWKCKEFKCCLLFFVFYIVYSYFLPYNSLKAILLDSLQQIKPFVFFYFAYRYGIHLSKKQKENIVKLCILMTILSVPFGIIQDINLQNSLLFHHPGDFGCTLFSYSLIIYFLSEDTRKTRLLCLLILLLGLFSFRSKYYGYFISSIFIVKFVKDRVKISLSYIIMVSILIACVLYFTREKVTAYTSDEAMETAARTILYLKMPELLLNNLPFGTGLASYATYFSGAFYSNLYSKIGIDNVYGLTSDYYAFIADTYFPIFVQFGVFGILVFIMFWKRRYRQVSLECRRNIKYYRMSLIIFTMIFIESLASPYLGTFYSFVPMMILGHICRNNNRYEYKCLQTANNIPI